MHHESRTASKEITLSVSFVAKRTGSGVDVLEPRALWCALDTP